MRGNSHVRFGERAGETGRPKGRHRAPVRLDHSCASLLFELGVPLRMVMEILGHSQISTTSDIYTHVMPAQYREVADALDIWLADEKDDDL